VRESYSEAIKLLSASHIKEDKKLAKELKGYLETMAKELVTQNHEMKQKIYKDITASRKDQIVVNHEVSKMDMER
jgi:NADPH-dependent 7-cyano-7-deazaguanine reductase QueF-like protein